MVKVDVEEEEEEYMGWGMPAYKGVDGRPALILYNQDDDGGDNNNGKRNDNDGNWCMQNSSSNSKDHCNSPRSPHNSKPSKSEPKDAWVAVTYIVVVGLKYKVTKVGRRLDWYTLIESCNGIMRLMAEFRHI